MTAPRPYTLVAELSYRCPLKCVYCSNPIDYARIDDEIDTDAWKRVLSDAAKLGVVQAHLSGGEPLVRDDVEALVAHARREDLYTNLITGGTMLDRDRLEALKRAGLDHVQLSLQDAEQQGADRIAGLASHQTKIEVAALVRAAGLPLTLNVVLHRHNIARVPELIRLAEALGADRLELANTQYYAWALENRSFLLPRESACREAEAIVKEARVRLRGKLEIAYVMPDYFAETPKACMGGWARSYMLVDPGGTVLPCHAARVIRQLRFESVKDRPLFAIWNDSPALLAFRGEDWMQEPCRSCPERAKDFGGCRCQAMLLAGDPAATDPVCKFAPRHAVVVEAIARASATPPPSPSPEPVYRTKRNSLRLAGA
jgi:pyrroloquinoline quinone biosynthesis protein E